MSKAILAFLVLITTQGLWAKESCTLELQIRDVIGPATYDYLQRAEKRAQEKGCVSIFAKINTPGGSLQSTRKIVEMIMSSKIPYLCLIHPSGGHAGSAGAIIMQACHINGAMEATNIGAATPVSGSGTEIPEDLRKKLFEDTKSWLEGLAKYRGRNIEFVRDIVLKAKALDAKEAEKQQAIDVVVNSQDEFLQFAKAKKVKVNSEEFTPVAVGVLQAFMPDLRHDVLQILSNPQWAYLLFMGSLGLLYFELTHPGVILPGVVGAIGLVISLMNFHMLDVSWGGVFLILLGLSFMFAELFVPSFGALGLGGLASFVIGSLFLFDGQDVGRQLPLSIVLATSLFLFTMTFALTWFAVQAMKRGKINRIKESGLGQKVVIKSYDSQKCQGYVRYHGELWKCEGPEDLKENDEVVIKEIAGLTIKVARE